MSAVGRFGARVWSQLGGDPELLERVSAPRPALEFASHLDVAGMLTDAVSLEALALSALRSDRTSMPLLPVRCDAARIATSAESERHLRVGGERWKQWAPLSRFWRARDRWVRTHAGLPHHAARLRRVLGLREEDGAEVIGAAIAERDAFELEEAAAAGGAIVAAVRSASEWRVHPQGSAAAQRAPIRVMRLSDAPPRVWSGAGIPPLAGVRVLDLTLLVAGPVCTRDLALAGAEVLRIDAPARRETTWQYIDTGQGKYSAWLDLGELGNRPTLERLLQRADVVVTSYRTGSLDSYDLAPEAIAARRPGVVVASLNAWGAEGPWAKRRGVDSVVQAATGIAMFESPDGKTPGELPVSALAHTAGHVLATAVIECLRQQAVTGGSRIVSLSLAGIAHRLIGAGAAPERSVAGNFEPTLVTAPTRYGRVECAAPVFATVGDYRWIGHAQGIDSPAWR